MNPFNKMKIIKNEKDCTPEYIQKLHDWIMKNAEEYFNDKNNWACAWIDFDFYNKTTDREHLVMPDEVMLIDRRWKEKHSYVICKINKSGDKAKNLHKVIEIDEIRPLHWRNGYFLLPDLP